MFALGGPGSTNVIATSTAVRIADAPMRLRVRLDQLARLRDMSANTVPTSDTGRALNAKQGIAR